MTIKIKLPEGVVFFHTSPYDLPQANVEQFIEDEKGRFVKWVQLFMPNYKWIGNHRLNQVEVYKSQYGVIKYSEAVVPTGFEIIIVYQDINTGATLSIISNNDNRYEKIKSIISELIQGWLSGYTSYTYDLKSVGSQQIKGIRGIISTLIQTWLSGHTSIYHLKSVGLRQIKGRIGVEIIFTFEDGADFYWFELPPMGIADYTSFDISGAFTIYSNIADIEKDKADLNASWHRFVNDL